jgi:hypothetical protein
MRRVPRRERLLEEARRYGTAALRVSAVLVALTYVAVLIASR